MLATGSTDHRVRVRNHIVQLLQESVLNDQFRLEVVQLGYAQRCGLANVGVLVSQTLLQWIAEIVYNLLRPQTSHCPDCQSTDERIRIVAVFDEGVHRKDDKLGLGFGIVHEIQINQLLLLEVVCLHILENIGKETADI